MSTATEPRMKVVYREQVRDALKSELDLPNVMMVPKLEKIVINMGVGAALTNRANLDGALEDLTELEAGDRLLGPGHDRLLAGDDREVV